MTFDLADYIDVNERISLFYAKHPEGSLGFEYMGVMEGNPDMIWGIAYAYRDRDDPRPGVGVAAELAKGTTPYTRHSELQNLQTSCWGRAIAALGIGLGKKGLATVQEIEAARARQEPDRDKQGRKKSVPVTEKPVPEHDPWFPPEPAEEIQGTPSCMHGPREYREGVSKNGKEWRAWMCTTPLERGKCMPMWVQ